MALLKAALKTKTVFSYIEKKESCGIWNNFVMKKNLRKCFVIKYTDFI